MRRRDFLLSTLVAAGVRRARAQDAPPLTWRTFEITTSVHVQHASGITRVWVPTPLVDAPYQRTLGDTYRAEDGAVAMIERDGLDLLAGEWKAGVEPALTLVSRIATSARMVDLSTPSVPPPKDLSAFGGYLRPLRRPTRGGSEPADLGAIVARATGGIGTDVERARALFTWTLGAGAPDANATFVSLVRNAGIPARLVHGLGLAAADATRAHADRVEVYLVGFGWVPADAAARQFGSWSAEWVAFNSAEDVALPGAVRGTVSELLRPQAETGGRRIEGVEADEFRYRIAVRELV